MMTEGTMQLNELRDPNDEVEQGDKVVTSHVSAKFHKGILIGYVNEIHTDANNLTKSGSLTPAVDFEHLSTVLVITDLKQQVDVNKADGEEADSQEEQPPVSGDETEESSGTPDGESSTTPDVPESAEGEETE